MYYDRHAKPLLELEIGQTVKLQPLRKGGTWKKVQTVNKLGERSYFVQTNDGMTYRRNRKFIRAIPEPMMELGNSADQVANTPSITDSESVNDDALKEPSPAEAEKQTTPDQSEPTIDSLVKRTASGGVVKQPGKIM